MRVESKPIIGSAVRYVDTGATFGVVLNFHMSENICNVLKPDGEISCFIWRFKGCLNSVFTWGGKK